MNFIISCTIYNRDSIFVIYQPLLRMNCDISFKTRFCPISLLLLFRKNVSKGKTKIYFIILRNFRGEILEIFGGHSIAPKTTSANAASASP